MTISPPAPAPVLPPLQLGRFTIGSPVVLAPMAGITNRAFRRLCRQYGAEGLAAGGASGATVQLLVTEDRADHIDLNFGCPVPKVTRKGGGAALPWKLDLFRGIVSAAVREAAPYDVPVTVKMRVGIDSDHVTFLEAGRI